MTLLDEDECNSGLWYYMMDFDSPPCWRCLYKREALSSGLEQYCLSLWPVAHTNVDGQLSPCGSRGCWERLGPFHDYIWRHGTHINTQVTCRVTAWAECGFSIGLAYTLNGVSGKCTSYEHIYGFSMKRCCCCCSKNQLQCLRWVLYRRNKVNTGISIRNSNVCVIEGDWKLSSHDCWTNDSC